MQFLTPKLYHYIDMKNFKCFYCDSDLIWQNDFDNDDCERITHYYSCLHCGAEYAITEPDEKETAD